MFNIKELFAGIVLILILGIAGFLYRNAVERPVYNRGNSVSCALEVKTCPDKTLVGRVGPTCDFAPCPAPNVELSIIGVSFVLPKGFTKTATSTIQNKQTHIIYEAKNASSTKSISVRAYPITATDSAQKIMLENTKFDTKSFLPRSMNNFKKVSIGRYSFKKIQIKNIKEYTYTMYWFPRGKDVLLFDMRERSKTNTSTNASTTDNLSENSALQTLLLTVQIGNT